MKTMSPATPTRTMARTTFVAWMRLAVFGVALLHACAHAQEPGVSAPGPAASAPATPDAGSARRFQGRGFTVSAPADDWVAFAAGVPGAITLAKLDDVRAQALRQGASVIFAAVPVPVRGHDLSTPDGLRGAIRAFIEESNRRFKLVSFTLEPLAESGLGTDCLRLETVSEERNNRAHPGQVLLLSTFGRMCRHPGLAHTLVQVACSERRVAGMPSVVDDAVRAECAAAVASLRFEPTR